MLSSAYALGDTVPYMSHLMELRAVWGSRPLLSVGVSVLIQDEQGRILLQQRGDDGLWGVLGGALEPGEDFLQAAHRELQEETGLTCPNLTLIPLNEGLVGGPQFYHRYPNGHEIYLVGRRAHGTLPASALAHAAPDNSGETLALNWFPLSELPPLNSNINLSSMNVLRARTGLPALPLQSAPTPPPLGNHMRELRALVGTYPLFAAGTNVLVTDEHGRLLLLKQNSTGLWTPPGGSLELGETFEDCARRELIEETGLTAETLEPVQMYAGAEYRFTYPHGDVIDNICVLYWAHNVMGELKLQSEEVQAAQWFTQDELPAESELGGSLIRAMVQWWRDSHV